MRPHGSGLPQKEGRTMAPKKTVLLVDDDDDFLEMMRDVLASNGYRVLCAGSPEEALRSMETEGVDLVITDVMMDSVDSGLSLSRRIKSDPRFRHTRVAIATAISSQRGFSFAPRTPADLQEMCADDYFPNPIVPELLLAKIAALLRDRSQEDRT